MQSNYLLNGHMISLVKGFNQIRYQPIEKTADNRSLLELHIKTSIRIHSKMDYKISNYNHVPHQVSFLTKSKVIAVKRKHRNHRATGKILVRFVTSGII